MVVAGWLKAWKKTFSYQIYWRDFQFNNQLLTRSPVSCLDRDIGLYCVSNTDGCVRSHLLQALGTENHDWSTCWILSDVTQACVHNIPHRTKQYTYLSLESAMLTQICPPFMGPTDGRGRSHLLQALDRESWLIDMLNLYWRHTDMQTQQIYSLSTNLRDDIKSFGKISIFS